MQVKRRRLFNFETCSIALFTSLTLRGAAFPARSQTPSTPSVTSTTSTVPLAPSTLPSSPKGTSSFQIGPVKPSAEIPPDPGK